MENKRKLNSIEKIEEMFAEDIDLLQSGKSHTKKALEKIDTKFKINGSCSLFSASKKTGLKELQFKLMEWLIR